MWEASSVNEQRALIRDSAKGKYKIVVKHIDASQMEALAKKVNKAALQVYLADEKIVTIR